jgi:hypothetical protein
MAIDIISNIFTVKLNFLYVAFSLLGMHINFTIIKKLFHSKEPACHFQSIVISLLLPLSHFYVFNFGRIPFLNIDIGGNTPLYYASFVLAWVSSLPYIIARRLLP